MKHLSIILTFLLFQTDSFSQTEAWIKSISPHVSIQNNAIFKLGGKALGSTGASQWTSKWFVEKLDTNGNLVNSDTIGTYYNVYPVDMIMVNASMYVIVQVYPGGSFYGYSNHATLLVNFFGSTINWIKEIPFFDCKDLGYDKITQTLFITGRSAGNGGIAQYDGWTYQTGGVVGKFDLSGNCYWIKNIGNASTIYDITASGNYIYVAISYSSIFDLGRISQNGDLEWTRPYVVNGLITDTAGNCYVTGSAFANDTVSEGNYYLAKVSHLGDEVWWKRSTYGGAGKAITLTDEGDVIAAGFYGNNNISNGMGVEKYDKQGNEIWYYQLHKPTFYAPLPTPKYIFASNSKVYIGGYFSGQGTGGMLVKLYEPGVTASMKEISETTQLSVFPNPTTSIFTFNYKNDKSNEPVLVSVKSISGQVIYSQAFKPLSNTVRQTISIGRQAKGTYLLQVSQGEITETKKLVFE